MSELLKEIRKELKKNSGVKTKESFQRFFKEKIKCYGVKVPVVTSIGKKFYKKLGGLGKKEIFALCEKLFKSNYIEEAFIACGWAHSQSKNYEEGDFSIFESWVNTYVSNWAVCDTFCNHTVGDFLIKFPGHVLNLGRWAKSDNRWVRRASAVSLIVPAKKGMFLEKIFEICETLLLDSDDMVQKGYGWLLKEASRKSQKEVFAFVVSRRATMPRTALRYAIEKMPGNLKKRAMGRE